MIDNQDKDVTQASCEARFFLKQETGKRILYLNLPDGSDELNTIGRRTSMTAPYPTWKSASMLNPFTLLLDF